MLKTYRVSRICKFKTFYNNNLFRSQFREQPLVPLGCAATVYFLVTGIKAFRDQDPVKSQRMMRGRVAAQFITILCFIGYVGIDNCDFRIAPMYQDAKKMRAMQKLSEEGKVSQPPNSV